VLAGESLVSAFDLNPGSSEHQVRRSMALERPIQGGPLPIKRFVLPNSAKASYNGIYKKTHGHDGMRRNQYSNP